MLRGPGSLLARFGMSSEFKYQAVLTVKVVAAMVAVFGGIWVAELFLTP
jgi:hypothetical protein